MSAALMRKLGRVAVLTAVAAMLILLAGCLEQILVWSPDGQRAVAIDARDGTGLRLSDSNGKLSAPMFPGAYRVAWLPDSRQMVVLTVREEANWATVAKELTEEESVIVVERVEVAWKRLQAGVPWSEVRGLLTKEGPGEVLLACLRARHGDAVRAKLTAEERSSFDAEKAGISELAVVRIEGDSLVKGVVLSHGLSNWVGLRVSPDGGFLAMVRETFFGPNDTFELLVTSMVGGPAVKIAEKVAKWPDWTPDGQALVYAQGTVNAFGSLVKQEVMSADGEITASGKTTSMAGWIFNNATRVRCLRDGRIFFNAAEITLPITPNDFGAQHEQLFAVDPARQATLVRVIPRSSEGLMPRSLAFFEISPDEKKVLFGGYEGEVALLDIAEGAVRQIQEGGKIKMFCAPQWRTSSEFSYLRVKTTQQEGKPTQKGEVVMRAGDQERVLSGDWPETLVRGWWGVN